MGRLIEDCETLVAMLEDTEVLDTKIAAAQEEIDTVVEMNKALIREHAVTGVPQEEFNQKAKSCDEQFRSYYSQSKSRQNVPNRVRMMLIHK